jgi:hypothetical protein
MLRKYKNFFRERKKGKRGKSGKAHARVSERERESEGKFFFRFSHTISMIRREKISETFNFCVMKTQMLENICEVFISQLTLSTVTIL